ASETVQKAVVAAAEEAMLRAPGSVTDKPEPGPAAGIHDYYHPAPYWWPDPASPDGAYVRRDGMRVSGSTLYSPGSECFDRSRLQRLFDDGITLALAWRLSGKASYVEHAAQAHRRWFLAPETRMTPHLRFAQVRKGHDNNEGSA